MDDNIDKIWDHGVSWKDHIKSLDPNIINVEFSVVSGCTIIYFNSEEHKTWFVLRWM